MNTKKLPLLASTLIAASFALAVPALADPTYLPETAPSGDSPQASSGVIEAGDYAIASNATQGWISPNGAGTGSIGIYNISFGEGTTFSGSGLFGIYFVQGSGDGAETVDLTNVTASGLSGQLIVLNNWNNETDVKLLGESWASVEYIFANAVDDTELATKYGLTDYSRGALDSDFASKGLNDTLALQGATTLAGVTGASKGVTIYDSTGATEVLCDHEFITVTSEGTTLTIAGSGTYGFYGTVGADASGNVTRASLAMTGSGSQTFGGTNYLYDVTVSAGTLALGGTTDISGTVSVAEGSTLDLSGTITLGSAIQNSGTVVVDSDVVFVLDNLTPDSNTYTIISNSGSITGWDSLDYTNFGLDSARQLTSSSNGTIVVDTTQSAHDLTWNGSGSVWDSGNSENTVWTNSGSSDDYFVNGDNVTFSSSGSTEITVSGDVHAGTMTVSSGNYTFTASTGDTLTVDSVNLNSSDAITFTGGGEFTITGDYTVANSSSTQGASLTVGEGTSVTMKNYDASWHQNTTTLGTGATLTVTTQMWFHTNSTEELTGGTFNIEQLTVSNATTIVSIHDTNLNIGTGDARGGLKADDQGYFIFGDNLTVGVYAGASGTNTGWSTTADIQFTKGDGTGTTFSTKAGETITLGGSISGVGFTNTGSGTLTLSGTVALSDAIINSGNIVLDASTVSIAVDSLTMQTYTGDGTTSYYEIITGSDSGNVTFENGSYANFTSGGESLSSSWSIYTTDGYLVIYRTANDLTWAGTSGNNTWNYTDENWSDGASAAFSEGDNVTFGTISGDISSTVDITTDINAGSITVNDDYTFTSESAVTVDAGGDLKVSSGATLTIDSNVTLYIDEVEENFSVDGKITGSGTIEIDLTGTTYASTVNLGDDNEFAGTVYIHSGEFHLYGSNIGSGTYRLGDGVNIEIATSGVSVSNDFIIEGTTELHVNSGDSLTISGNVSGVEDADSVMGGNFDRHGAGNLTISGNVDIGTFTIDSTNSTASSTTTFTGSSVKIGALNVVYADSVIFSSGTTTIGSLTFSAAGTVTFNSDATITGNIAFTTASGEALAIGDGATLTVGGNLTDTDANNATGVRISLGEGSTLNVTGAISAAPGGAGSYYTQIAGQGADKSTVIAGSFKLGDESTGGAFEVNGATFITGGITFGTAGGSNFNLYLKDATLGFTEDEVTIAPTGTSGSTSRFVLGAFVGNSSDTGTGTTTTINTSKYDAEAGDFTNDGVTVTISQVISGHGALVVTGNGSLTLSAENTFDGGLTIDAGKVIAANNSALGDSTGEVTIKNGGQLEVSSSVTISNNINIILGKENISTVSPDSLVVTLAAAGDTDVYALIGEGSIASGVTITITVDEAVKALLAEGGTYTFDIYDSSSLTLSDGVAIDYSALEAYGTVSWNQGVLTIVSDIPEPSMFGVFFGLGAIGLVATRRRRKVA